MVVAPSGPVPHLELEAGLAVLAARYDVVRSPGLGDRTGFLAGSDESRLHHLNSAFDDPTIRAVVAARGGYGLTRLLPFISPERLRGAARPIVAFSDGTALLAAAARAGVVSIHGPVVTQLGRLGEADRGALFRLLEDPTPGVLLDGLEALMPGRVTGRLIGGNLEVFSRLLGTPHLPDLSGAVLLIEDVGERPYRIDRLLTHLDLAGVFGAVAGVVVGDFSACLEPGGAPEVPTAAEVIEERLGRLAVPVALGAPVGHGARNVALPHGALVELDTLRGTLTALEGAVS